MTDHQDSDLLELGMRIRAVRRINGYEKSIDFIHQHKFDRGMFYQWEQGKRLPSDQILKKISQICRVNYIWLKTGHGDPFENVKITQAEMKNKKADLEFALRYFSRRLKKKHPSLDACASPSAEMPVLVHEPLMTAIAEKLFSLFNSKNKKINPTTFAKIFAATFTDILKETHDPAVQLKLVNGILKVHQRYLSNAKLVGHLKNIC